MAIFARRRLQTMIDDLAPYLAAKKVGELIKYLDGSNTTQAMSAEAELSLTWAVSQASAIVVEPDIPGTSSKVDLVAHHLFPTALTAVEITALSDDSFSGREVMERAASIITQTAKRFHKAVEPHLHFSFNETSSYQKNRRTGRSQLKRQRTVSDKYTMTAEHEEIIRTWVRASDWPNPPAIRLTNEHIDVVVRWEERVHPEGRIFCTMPPVAYDLRDNPLYKQLKRKDDQLSGMPRGMLRCVLLVDVGCQLLRRLQPMSSSGQEKGGADIIHHFLESSKVDIVCVFSQQEASPFGRRDGPRVTWQVTIFDRAGNRGEVFYTGLRQTAGQLPLPRYAGYAARSLHRQGAFDPASNRDYPAVTITSRGDTMSIQLSARLVHDLIAGLTTQEEFLRKTFGDDPNLFATERARGMTLKDVKLVSEGPDRDDDLIVFDLASDAAVRALAPPPPPKLSARLRAWASKAILKLRLSTGLMETPTGTQPLGPKP